MTGVAVVELFTSQGCNSCPPADAALRKIEESAQRRQLPVYCLSFHVDYWNRLGWTDPYSSAAFSARQRAYAAANGKGRVYTPQMIISGTSEFVGSNVSRAHQAINASLRVKTTSKLSLQLDSDSSRQSLSVRYDVKGATLGNWLNVALVQTPPANKVPRGENAGRSLSHVNIVRVFKTVTLTNPKGSLEISVPEGVDLAHAELIAYVQDSKHLQIGGAAAIKDLGATATPESTIP